MTEHGIGPANLDEMLQLVGQGIIYLAADGKIALFNRSAERIFGLPAREVIGHLPGERLGPWLREDGSPCPAAELPWAQTLATGQALDAQVRGLARPDQSVLWLSLATRSWSPPEANQPSAVVVSCTDITASRQKAAEFRASHDVFHALFDNMINGYAYCRMLYQDGRPVDFLYLRTNRAFSNLTGLTGVEGKKVSEVIPGITEKDPGLLEIYGRVASGGGPERFDTYVESLQMWFAISVYCPQPEHFVAVFDVITERKKTEENLRTALQRLRFHFENSPLGVVEFDRDFRVLFWSAQATRIFGWQAEEILGQRISDLKWVHEDDEAQVSALLEDMFRGRRTSNVNYNRNYRKDGTVVYCEWYNSALLTPEGELQSVFSSVLDITERHAMEEALRQSEQYNRSLVEHLPQRIFLKDRNSVYVSCNDNFARDLGIRAEEVRGMTDFELFPPELARKYRADDQRVMETGTPLAEEEPYQARGQRRWVRINKLPYRDAAGRLTGVLGIFEDVTDRRQAEEAVRESEAFIRTILDNLPVGVAVNSVDNTVLLEYVNDKFLQLYRVKREQLTSTDAFWEAAYEDPVFRENVKRRVLTDCASGDPARLHWEDVPITRRGEKTTFVSARNVPIPEKNLVLSIVWDVTERKRAEDALRISEEKFSKAFLASPVWVTVSTIEEGRFLEVNDSFTTISGYSREEALGRTASELNLWLDPEHDRQRALAAYRRDGRLQNLETGMRCKDGRVLSLLWSADPFEYEGQACFINVMVDITEQKKAQEEKARLEDQLRQSQKMEALGTLAGGIAHDFNNILGAVIGFSEMALESAKAGQNPSPEIRQVLRAGSRARDLVRRILTFSRKMEVELQPLALNREINRVVELLGRTLPKMIRIETKLAPDLAQVLANRNQLEQILLNLATNAQDAMPEGGRLILETRNVILEDAEYCRQHLEMNPGPYVLLEVSDTGLGMAEGVREHIFEPFFTTKEVGKGTGLGLSTVYGIIKSFDGHIFCYSEPGQGTSFKIYLPAYRQTALQAACELPSLPAPPLGGQESLLLVDDEETLRYIGAQTLSRAGYRVCTAANGEEAVALYTDPELKFDLVILDLGMPGMGGLKALQAIRGRNPGAKVLIASGYSANAQVKSALEAGATGHLAKPFSGMDLLATVRKLLDEE